jgi:hypothetical protein
VKGIILVEGGSVTNQAGGTISGDRFGIFVRDAGTVTNAGAISGKVGVNMHVQDSNTGAAGTVTNAGTISGTTASVVFAGPGANTLTLETGSTLIGDAIGSTASGATNALVPRRARNREQQFRQLQHAGPAGERELDARR